MTPGSPLPAICAGAAAAGPLFLASSAIASLYLQLPQPVTVDVPQVVAFLIMLLPALVAGFCPAFVMGLFGSLIMGGLKATGRAAWAAAGAAAGYGLAVLLLTEAANSFALVATSSVCALICRNGVDAD
jgi:hypothetical protein